MASVPRPTLKSGKSQATLKTNNAATRLRSKEDRVVRVFMSSTFRDMQAERDEFFNFAVHRIQAFAKKRMVELIFIDLRWGVTEEDSQTGKVIELCLDGIEKSTYCICFLGERYGWIPDRNDPAQWSESLNSKYPWVLDFSGKSVTEMEIQFAGLKEGSICHRILFYERNHAKLMETLSSSGDILKYDAESAEHKKMQDNLKSMIRERYPIQVYDSPRHLAETIIQEMIRVIDEDFPEDSMDTDWEEACHRQFARSRLVVFCGREVLISTIMDKIQSNLAVDHHKPIILSAESGIGKSSLVAAIARRYDNPSYLVFSHYVGCSNQSSFVENIVSRCTKFAGKNFFSQRKGTDHRRGDPSDMSEGLVDFIGIASRFVTAQKPLLIFIDAVNQLHPSEKCKEPFSLAWIPNTLPKNIQLIISTINTHPSSKIAIDKGMPPFSVSKLNPSDIKDIVTSFFERYSKKLTQNQLDVICENEQSGHPLFLRTVLDELRVFGVYENLDIEIQTLLSTGSPLNLYSLIIGRWEIRYGLELVEEILVMLHISKIGLTEGELDHYVKTMVEDETGSKNWKSLFFMVLNLLFVRNGRLAIFHQLLHEAIVDRYLFTVEKEKKYFTDYATWIQSVYGSVENLDEQIMSEICNSLLVAEKFEDLATFLSKEKVVEVMLPGEYRYTFFQSWIVLRKQGFDPTKSYHDLSRQLTPAGTEIIEFFIESFDYEYCQAALLDRLTKIDREENKHFEYYQLGRVTAPTNRNASLEYFEKSIEIRRKIYGEVHPEVASVYYSMARVYKTLRNLQLALKFHKKALEIQIKTLGEKDRFTSLSYGGTGSVLKDMKQYKEAQEYHEKSLEINIALFGENHPATAFSYVNIGLVHKEQDRCDEAVENYKKALAIRLNIFGEAHHETATCYDYMGVVYRNARQYDKALENHLKALEIRETVWGKDNVQTTVVRNNLGIVYRSMDKLDEALEQFEKTYEIRKAGPEFVLKENIFILKNIIEICLATNKKDKMMRYCDMFAERSMFAFTTTRDCSSVLKQAIPVAFELNDFKRIYKFHEQLFWIEIQSAKPTPEGAPPKKSEPQSPRSLNIKHLCEVINKAEAAGEKLGSEFAVDRIQFLVSTGDEFHRLELFKEAEIQYLSAIALLKVNPNFVEDFPTAHFSYIDLLISTKRESNALEYMSLLMKDLKAMTPTPSKAIGKLLLHQSKSMLASDKPTEALKNLTEWKEYTTKENASEPSDLYMYYITQVRAEKKNKNYELALGIIEKAQKDLEDKAINVDLMDFLVLERIDIYQILKEYDRGLELAKECAHRVCSRGPPNRPIAVACKEKLDTLTELSGGDFKGGKPRTTRMPTHGSWKRSNELLSPRSGTSKPK